MNETTPSPLTSTLKNKKTMRIAGIAVLLVIIIALFINARSHRTAGEQAAVDTTTTGCNPGDLFSQTTGKPCVLPTAADNADTDYQSTVMSYRGKSLTFIAGCAALPADATYDKGTRVLINNISSAPITVTLNDKKVILSPFHYATTVFAKTGTFAATCNDKEVAHVTVK
jgi:hypothetical protein